MKLRNKSATPLIALGALCLIILVAFVLQTRPRQSSGQPEEVRETQTIDSSTSHTASNKAPARSKAETLRKLETINQKKGGRFERAATFDHDVRNFDGWSEMSLAEIIRFENSLIAQFGMRQTGELELLYFKNKDEFQDPRVTSVFRKIVLGVWCAKDIDGCINAIDQHFDPATANTVRRDAMEGWVAEDWLTALRYMDRKGELAIIEQMGGDSSKFVETIVQSAMNDFGKQRAQEIVTKLKQPIHRQVALEVLQNSDGHG